MGNGPVDEAVFDTLKQALPDVDEASVRAAVRESGREMSPVAEGVRQETLDELERTLSALADEYERGDPARKRQVRNLVIVAKEHAGFAARSSRLTDEKRALKEEMLLWLRTWLENPGLFGVWVAIRKRRAVPGPL